MKKQKQTKLGATIQRHINLIDAVTKGRSNPFLSMAAQAAKEEAEKNPNGRQ